MSLPSTAQREGFLGRQAGTRPRVTFRTDTVGAGSLAGRHVESRTPISGVAIAGIADPVLDRAERLAGRAAAAGSAPSG
jgi:hypothetical protein